MSLVVIFNPRAGRRRTQRRLARLEQRWRGVAEFWASERPGHAEELAREACARGFRLVAAAGGDGTVHEVANGLLSEPNRDVTLAVVPLGSANDFAWSLRQQFGDSTLDDERAARVDVGLVSDERGRERYFIEGLGLGLAGEVTLESQQICHLSGVLLYGLAAWRALARSQPRPLVIEWDDSPPAEADTLLLSLLLGRREGNFLLAPEARLDDGLFDFVHAGPIGRWAALRMIPRLAFWGPPRNHPQVRLGRCRRVRIDSSVPLTVHADGEMFCTPDQNVRQIEVQLLPSRLSAKVCPLLPNRLC